MGERMTKLQVKNWAKFQHFKDRCPPWVKLYRDILDDPDWHSLSGDDAKTLVMIWLIASEDRKQEGTLPSLRKLAFRLRISESVTEQVLARLSSWLIQDDISAISSRYQDDAPETETKAETEKKREEKNFSFPQEPLARPEPFILPPSVASSAPLILRLTERTGKRWNWSAGNPATQRNAQELATNQVDTYGLEAMVDLYASIHETTGQTNISQMTNAVADILRKEGAEIKQRAALQNNLGYRIAQRLERLPESKQLFFIHKPGAEPWQVTSATIHVIKTERDGQPKLLPAAQFPKFTDPAHWVEQEVQLVTKP